MVVDIVIVHGMYYILQRYLASFGTMNLDNHRVNGCVGLSNYRYYIQFLCYTSLLGTWTFATSLGTLIEFHGLVSEFWFI
jgi:hypothetical protein